MHSFRRTVFSLAPQSIIEQLRIDCTGIMACLTEPLGHMPLSIGRKSLNSGAHSRRLRDTSQDQLFSGEVMRPTQCYYSLA